MSVESTTNIITLVVMSIWLVVAVWILIDMIKKYFKSKAEDEKISQQLEEAMAGLKESLAKVCGEDREEKKKRWEAGTPVTTVEQFRAYMEGEAKVMVDEAAAKYEEKTAEGWETRIITDEDGETEIVTRKPEVNDAGVSDGQE